MRGSPSHVGACTTIARDLGEFFNEDAIGRMPRDLVDHRLYVAEEDGEVQGFIALHIRNSDVAEVSWLAVRRELWRNGIGTELFSRAEEELREAGFTTIEAKTLADTADYPPYEGTRAFYRAMGFVHLQTIDPFPGWAPGNPCALYVMTLR